MSALARSPVTQKNEVEHDLLCWRRGTLNRVWPRFPVMAVEMTQIYRIILALVLLLVQPSYANSSVVTLGSFSNQRQSISDDPHIEGYSLMLYREGEIVFGRFCWATGIEIPCAPIQKAVIGRAGKLTFETKLSIGQEISKDTGPQGRPAYRLVTFRGKIGKNSIPGVVSIKSAYAPNTQAETESVTLKRTPFKGGALHSYQAWAQDPLNKPAD